MNASFPRVLKTVVVLWAILPWQASAVHAAEDAKPFAGNVQFRGSLDNARIRFDRDKKGTVWAGERT